MGYLTKTTDRSWWHRSWRLLVGVLVVALVATIPAAAFASLAAEGPDLRSYLGGEFRLGIGVAYGPMVVGELGFALKRQFTAIGDTVNVAARLESETRKQQADLLISDSLLKHLVPGSVEIKNSFNFDLKGKTENVVAHEVAVSS